MQTFRWMLRAGACVGLFLLWSSCGGTESTCGEGKDDMPSVFNDDDTSFDTFWIGSLGVNEELKISGQSSEHNTLVQAHFNDFSQYQMFVADRVQFSPACVMYVGRPEVIYRCRSKTACSVSTPCPANYDCLDGKCYAQHIACNETQGVPCSTGLVCENDGQPAGAQGGYCFARSCDPSKVNQCGDGAECVDGRLNLGLEQVVFSGLSGGDVTLQPDPLHENAIPTKLLDQRGFLAANVSIQVASANGERDFPSFSDQVRTPSFPKLNQAGDAVVSDLSSGPSLGITINRGQPFPVEWESGAGDYVEIKLIPGTGTSSEWVKLRCITFDDGCLEIPFEAITYLAQDTCTNFKLRLERHNLQVHRVTEGDQLKGVAVIDVSAELEGVVKR
jgi:hypothetical protein